MLITLFEEFKGSLKFTDELLCVLRCFLDPTNMIKEEEVPEPLNPKAEVLEFSLGGQVRNRKHQSNAEKVDEIWNFFNAKNKGNTCF